MSVALVYKPKVLLRRMKQWLTLDDEFGKKLYARIQDAEHMDAERVVINGDEADYLLRKFLD